MAEPKFVHLRLHTEFSMVDGINRIKPLINRCKKLGMPAIAMTDQSNMCGLVRFYGACVNAGIKPIAGVDAWVSSPEREGDIYRVVLLATNRQGFLHLSQLISLSYTQGQKMGKAIMDESWFPERTDGIIVLSGGKNSDIGKALLDNDLELAQRKLGFWNTHFKDHYYIEVQRTGRINDETYLHKVVGLAQGANIPIVATNEVVFMDKEDFEAHEARVCINQGRVLDDPRRPKNYSVEQYLKTEEEMCELFSDLPEALENSVEIAKRCNLEMRLGEYFLPDFPIPDGLTINEYFRKFSHEGLQERFKSLFSPEQDDYDQKIKEYTERLDIELDVICNMGFPGYFLIVADFIQWSKDNGIPVGPGRGSGAGSLVAYALLITDIDPLAYDLLFERFLNPERVSMPDFDIDFCMDGRDKVIDYVSRHYGRNSVSQIITFGTLAAKAVIRDVGRVLGKSYGFVDRIAKLIPFEIGMTLTKAFEDEPAIPEMYRSDEEVRELWDLAKKLEGITRNAGKHAGGVVIAPTDLTDFAPLYCDENGDGLVTQFDKDDVESAGLVKFDFLGLRTLTIIDWAMKTINALREKAGEEPLDINAISIEDAQVYKLLQEANTTAVFQLESRGMKEMIKKLKPSCFEDIIALVALYRPGPLGSGMVDDFIDRKHGKQEVVYPHPSLEEVLKPTYGTILYQEQVMQIAQVLASFSLGGADLLRRAMGKKKAEVMEEQGKLFVEGAKKNGVDPEQAQGIFDLMAEFAKYGFNKSHSAAYALVSYQTAWLKQYYPAAFMAAVMSSDMDNTDKVVTFIDDSTKMGLEISPPDVNRGHYKFTVDGDTIIYGIGAIKGVGEGAIDGIIAEREANGPYADLFDFCNRVDLRKTNKRVLEALTKAGALDKLGPSRAVIMASIPEAMRIAEQNSRNQLMGQDDLFGGPMPGAGQASGHFTHARPWTEEYLLQAEKDTLGLFLTGHPIERYLAEIEQFNGNRIRNLSPTRREQTIVIAALVVAVSVKRNKKGDKWCIVTLDDQSGRIDMKVYSNVFEEYNHLLVKDKVIVVDAEVGFDSFNDQGTLALTCKTVRSFSQTREAFADRLQIDIVGAMLTEEGVEQLKDALEPYQNGRCPVVIKYRRYQAKGIIKMGEQWYVEPTDDLMHRLNELDFCELVEVIYL
jgi:DNA polymerase III subunit alpha